MKKRSQQQQQQKQKQQQQQQLNPKITSNISWKKKSKIIIVID